MKKILVPIDGSASSIEAAKQALAFAKAFDSEVTFLSVVEVKSEIPHNIVGYGMVDQYYTMSESMLKMRTEYATSMLNSIVETLDCAGVQTEQKIVVGDVNAKIIEAAAEGHYDLIIMGHRGLNPIQRFFIGSVAKRVLEHAPCSVLIVRK